MHLARAKLVIDQLIDPTVDVAGTLQKLDDNHSPEDLSRLTPELLRITVEKMHDTMKTGDCSCLD